VTVRASPSYGPWLSATTPRAGGPWLTRYDASESPSHGPWLPATTPRAGGPWLTRYDASDCRGALRIRYAAPAPAARCLAPPSPDGTSAA
jgi:hypothetical protein